MQLLPQLHITEEDKATPSQRTAIFPYVLLRIAGGSFDKLEKLHFKKVPLILDRIISLKHESETVRHSICDDMYGFISTITDSHLQNKILNLKRDIFNDREIDPLIFESLTPVLPDELREKIGSWQGIKNEIKNFCDELEQIYNEELPELEKSFKDITNDIVLQKGLILSSQSLLKRLVNYLNPEIDTNSKDDNRIQQSLIKYISRLYAKTSPFSTFTNLAICKLPDAGDELSFGVEKEHLIIDREAEFGKATSHIRLNNFLFQYLKGLLFKNPDIYRWFLLRPNPTIKQVDNQFVFLTNCNNIESFQKMPVNQAIEVFLILTRQKNEGVTMDELVKTVIENEYIDAPAEDIESFIGQLIDYGFLEFNLGVSGIDPDWDIKLCERMIPISEKSGMIKELISVLREMRLKSQIYADAGIEERKEYLVKAHSIFKDICYKLHEAAGLPEEERLSDEERKKLQEEKKKEKKEEDEDKKEDEKKEEKDEVFKHDVGTYFNFRPEQIYYEDSTVGRDMLIDPDAAESIISSLNRFENYLSVLDDSNEDMENMKFYFEKKYGVNTEVDVLSFYEDYYRDVKKPEAEKQEKLRKQQREKFDKKKSKEKEKELKNEEGIEKNEKEEVKKEDENPYLSPALKEKAERNKKLIDEIVSNLSSGTASEDNIDVQDVDLSRLFSQSHTNRQSSKRSFGVFVQPFIDSNNGDSRILAVVNMMLPGFGKFFSRFLHLFDVKATEATRDWNNSLSDGEIMAEDCDTSHFNANLHPPLMPYEVWLPGSQNSVPVERQIPVTELVITQDDSEHELKLIHKPTGKRAYIFDLCFQSLLGRSHLFQLLEKFTLVKQVPYYLLLKSINDKSRPVNKEGVQDDTKFWIRPRITFDDRIILQRKAWFIPKSVIPLKKQGETEAMYLCKLNEWRSQKGIPEEIFIFVLNRFATDNLTPEDMKKLSRDDYKPQYISFKNPFLVDLFLKLVNKVSTSIRIEEMLPNSQQLLRVADKRYVTEFVIQWYDYPYGE